ncbi:MAG TPA: class I SAM-dependent methyltransferase, partial [Anaerolineaceae bacterium]|nr:class I SAM-dependent methyltransferase [Anaerolineaceae bacterium]
NGVINVTDAVLSGLRPFLKGRVIDVATGRGDFLRQVKALSTDLRLAVGVDNARRAAASWPSALGENGLAFACADAGRLALASDAFDVVCISNSLHHLADLEGTIAELLRVLTPGGALVVNEMVRDGQTETQQTHVLLHHWWAEIDTRSGVEHHPTYARADLYALLRGLGLREAWSTEINDLSEDPHDPEAVRSLTEVCQVYPNKIQGHADYDRLRERGAALIERLNTVGFAPATQILWAGIKS